MYGLLSLHPWYHSPVGGVCAKRAATVWYVTSLHSSVYCTLSGLHRVSSHPTFRPSMTWFACNYHRIYWASGTQVLSRAHRGATILPLHSTADCGSCAEREHSCHGAWVPPFPVPPIPTLTISSIHAWDRSTHRCAHHCGCSGI